MENNNPILQSKTIPEFLKTVNDRYDLNLPTDFSGDSPVSKLLQTNIKVEPGKVESILYEARGDPFCFKNSSLRAKVIITVVTSEYANKNCYKRCICRGSPFNLD